MGSACEITYYSHYLFERRISPGSAREITSAPSTISESVSHGLNVDGKILTFSKKVKKICVGTVSCVPPTTYQHRRYFGGASQVDLRLTIFDLRFVPRCPPSTLLRTASVLSLDKARDGVCGMGAVNLGKMYRIFRLLSLTIVL